MEFKEIDELVGKILDSKYGSDNERRDYREMEKKDPITFKGYGSRNGVMYLVDHGYDFYIDVRLLQDSFQIVFREYDNYILDITHKNTDDINEYLSSFFELISEYHDLMNRFELFNRGNIPIDIKRVNRINEIIK